MCQAYENERAGIIDSEDRAAIKGFAAARLQKPKSDNPFTTIYFSYEKDAWVHGWECYHGRTLPWGLERIYHIKGDIQKAIEARNKFEQTGELLPELEVVVRNCGK